MSITARLGLALLTVAALLYGAARVVGLVEVVWKVDLVERSIRRGEGGQGLA